MMSEDPHSAEDHGVHGYMGYLNRNSVTIAEVLKEAGYHTYMSGKWHVGMHGQEKWPLQRGFDHFYGILSGACSYLQPHGDRNLTLDNQLLTHLLIMRLNLSTNAPKMTIRSSFTWHTTLPIGRYMLNRRI